MSNQPLRETELSRISFLNGNGNLPKIAIYTPWSTAEIYLHGAQLTHFQKHGEAPLLFLSQSSRFQKDAAIRGGIPICFPWFGGLGGDIGLPVPEKLPMFFSNFAPQNTATLPMHGFARLKEWNLTEIVQSKTGAVRVTLHCNDTFGDAEFSVDYVVTISQTLAAEFKVTNHSKSAKFTFEECLHTYFTVGDIKQVSVTGLKGASYLDKTANYARKQEVPEKITVAGEVDRTYLDTTSTVEILDTSLKRKILVEKTNSKSTVVWNPWIERARQMADLGDEEYKNFVCVESGNVGDNRVTLAPGTSSSLKIVLSSIGL